MCENLAAQKYLRLQYKVGSPVIEDLKARSFENHMGFCDVIRLAASFLKPIFRLKTKLDISPHFLHHL